MCGCSIEGLIDVNMTEIPMEETELKFTKFFDIEFGGHWKPKDCIPHWKVGVLLLSPQEAHRKRLGWVLMLTCAAGGHPDPVQKPPRASPHPLSTPHSHAAAAEVAVCLLRH